MSIQATWISQGVLLKDGVHLFVTNLRSILDLLGLIRDTGCFEDLKIYETIYRGCNCWVLNQQLIHKLHIE